MSAIKYETSRKNQQKLTFYVLFLCSQKQIDKKCTIGQTQKDIKRKKKAKKTLNICTKIYEFNIFLILLS